MHKCTNYNHRADPEKWKGVTHIIVSYIVRMKNNIPELRWVYLYFVNGIKQIVIMSTRENERRQIMTIASAIKKFLELVLQCEIVVLNYIWRKYLREVPKGNSGLYAFKFFLKNAREIHDPSNLRPDKLYQDKTYPTWDYETLYDDFAYIMDKAQPDEKLKAPRWLPRAITAPQMKVLKTKIREIVFYSNTSTDLPPFIFD